MVFYRKYRPQTIKELDNEEIRNSLYSFLKRDKIPQAFLFTGPKGLGKTSTARIIAKVINCERTTADKQQLTTNKSKKSEVRSQTLGVNNVDPCNKCYQCVSITNGTNLDILEIDGASNRGIDEIRDLREKVRLSPVTASKKVYIIDEVHMLTTEAFNALLKTLEEPPNHVVFILCTTEVHKVPATIVSRCRHIAFPIASVSDLVHSFKRIVKGEKLKVDDDILESIAKLSDGSFRDGAKILEELAATANGKKITEKLIEEKYQVSSINKYATDLFVQLEKRDTKEALKLISKIVALGIDMKHFSQTLMEKVHEALLVKAGVESKLRDSSLDINELKTLMELLAKAHSDIKYAVLPQLPLEIAIIEWSMKGALLGNKNFRVPHSLPSRHANSENFVPSPRQVNTLLEDLIVKIKPYNHSIAGVLRGCSLKEYNGKDLVIETKYKFHKEKLTEPKTLALIEKICKEISGKEILVSVLKS